MARQPDASVEDILQSLSTTQGEQGKAIALLASGLENISKRLDEFISATKVNLTALTDAQSKTSGSNWRFLVAVIGSCGVLALALYGGLYLLVQKDTGLAISPIESQNIVSIKDREELHKALDIETLRSTVNDKELAVQQAHNAEVEAQLNCMDEMRNVLFRTQQYTATILAQNPKLALPTLDLAPHCRVTK